MLINQICIFASFKILKQNTMKIFSGNKGILLSILTFSVIITGCLENTYEEYEKEEQKKIDDYIKTSDFSEADKLESGIYFRFIHDSVNDTITPIITGNTILVDYTGKYTDGTVFETTDSTTGKFMFPERYYVYGPKRLKVGQLMYGFDTTVRKMTPGDHAEMLIPSKYMWYDYNPVVYDVVLYEIIRNDSLYEVEMFDAFFKLNNFSKADTFWHNYNDDIIYWKVMNDGVDSLSDSPINVQNNDSVLISLTARYAEIQKDANGDTISTIGRIFYPLRSFPNQFIYKWGNAPSFPITAPIDSAVKSMALGDELEICAKASWAYGDDGFSDPYHNIIAVPARTPVHYQIKLLGFRRGSSDWKYYEGL